MPFEKISNPRKDTFKYYHLNGENGIIYESNVCLSLYDIDEISNYISKYREVCQFFQFPTPSDISCSSSSSTDYA
jgi:hypothetical protein